jgi:pyridoxal 5'-phosphate synthase subunit Pdx1
MLKGGVIMDVVTPDQAKIAEDAGAVAVMALERVPADIRAQGGVSRMSDPDMIDGIIEAVSIPVMAKARIGHFVEAQVLQELGVDYIDESEVLSPADYVNHIDKWNFTVPFVCGATNLGEALRRITEGAAMIRSKGEAGTGDVSEAMKHIRKIRGEIAALGALSRDELYVAAKELQAPYELVAEVAETGTLPVVLFVAGGRHTRRRRDDDAARRRRRVRRLRDLQERRPGRPCRRDREGDHVLRRPEGHRGGLARPRRGHGRHQRRRPAGPAPARRARLVTTGMPRVGVLALQGDVREHVRPWRRWARRSSRCAARGARNRLGARDPGRRVQRDRQAGADVRYAAADPRRDRGGDAGLRHVRRTDPAGGPHRRRHPRTGDLRRIDITVQRNAFGSQVDSFETELTVAGFDEPVSATFIRAPRVVETGPAVEVLASLPDGAIVAVRQGALFGTAFHPEVSGETRFHELFLDLVAARAS